MKKFTSAFISIFLSVFFTNSIAQSTSYNLMLKSIYKNTVPLVDADSLKNWLKQEDIFIVDSRSTEEYQVSHIQGAYFVDYDSFDLANAKKNIPKDKKIVVYCSVGYRSERIGEQLLAAGYDEVYNLHGGIFSWVNQEKEVVNSNGDTTSKVHAYNRIWGQWLQKGDKVY